jgi:hypothetical protein
LTDGGFSLDLAAAGRSRKKKGTETEQMREIAFANVEKANLIPEI